MVNLELNYKFKLTYKLSKMRKNRYIFYLFIVSLIILSCEKEIIKNEVIRNERNLTPELISLNEAQSDEDFNLIIKDFKLEKQINNNFKSNDSLNINFDYFYKLENNNNKSFTFLIERSNPSDSIIENLVVEKVNDTIRGYIIKYLDGHYQEIENNLHLYANVVKTEYQGNIQDLWNQNNLNTKSFSLSCGWVTTYTIRMCSVHGSFNSENSTCGNYGKSNWISSSNYVCNHVYIEDAENASSFDLSVPSSGGGGGGGGGSSSTSPGTSPIIPCEDNVSLEQTIDEDCLNGNNDNVLMPNQQNPECDKISQFFQFNPTMQGALNMLANSTLTEPNEIALTLQNDGTPTVYNESPEGETTVAIPVDPPSNYNMVSHIHIENDSTETMSVFSFEDIITYGKMCNNNKLDDDVIFFLSTGKGTHFAMTLTNTSKLCDFAYGKDVSLEELAMMDANQAIQSKLLRNRLYRDYYDINNPNSIISETNTDNEEVLEAFMEFISEADLGVRLFETDENFQSFSLLELENEEVIRKTCSKKN